MSCISSRLYHYLQFLSLLSLFVFHIPPASAEWTEVNDLNGTSEEFLDTDNCQFRTRYHDPESTVYRNIYFTPSTIHPYTSSSGAVNTQSLTTPVNLHQLSGFYKRNADGALSQHDFDQILDRFNNGSRTPRGLRINPYITRGGSQVTVRYTYFHEGIENWVVATHWMDTSYFTIEAQCRGAKLLESVTAVASSNYSNTFNIANAVDRDSDTYWIGGLGESSYEVTFDLGGRYKLSEMNINWYTNYAATDFAIEYSTDGENYSSLQTGLDKQRAIELAGSVATHIKVVLFELENSNFPVISEVTFNGWARN